LTSPVVKPVAGTSIAVHLNGGPMVAMAFHAAFAGSRSHTWPVPLSNHSMLG
jgi:hypothetical protein